MYVFKGKVCQKYFENLLYPEKKLLESDVDIFTGSCSDEEIILRLDGHATGTQPQ
jgi:hypothetical protein